MKHFLCFALGSLAFIVTNSKKITIQIDSEDVVNLFEGMMYSEILEKFADQLAQRRSKKNTLNNPYHPEDELWNHFDAAVGKEIKHVKFLKKDSREFDLGLKGPPLIRPKSDSLEKQNELFLNGNDVESDDILTEDEMKPLNNIIKEHNLGKIALNSTRNSTDEHLKKNIEKAVNNDTISSKKDEKKILDNDRAYFKPIQRRFVVKGSNDKD